MHLPRPRLSFSRGAKDRRLVDYHIDSPVHHSLQARTVHVEGWIMPVEFSKDYYILVETPGSTTRIDVNVKRPDVLHFLEGKLTVDATEECGFATDIDYEDGNLKIWLMAEGEKLEKLYEINVFYSPEVLTENVVNPNMSSRMAKQQMFVAQKKQYHYEANNELEYIPHKDDPRLVAFYLPQFHPFPINDTAWGAGFTEWTNVTKAVPRFVGHQQPVLPGGMGFYDLRVEDTMRQQINLAKQHGLYGFCFYYYWFSGDKVMDTPLNSFLKHEEWDFNFTICWANENWTKRWDGRDQDIIIGQKYRKDDPLKFIKEVAPILNDSRYIHQDNRPVLLVYRASELRDPARYARLWRRYFKDTYGKELYLVSCMGFDVEDPRKYGFDAGLDFSPQTNFFKLDMYPGGSFPYVNQDLEYIDTHFSGAVTLYRDTALNAKLDDCFNFPTIRSIAPSWDNDARKKGGGFVMSGANPDLYGAWLNRLIKLAHKDKQQLVFVNAWNEWAEGAILEPSDHFGYANLNRTTEVLAQNSKNGKNKNKHPLYGAVQHGSSNNSEAVSIHIEKQVDASELVTRVKSEYPRADVYLTSTLKYQDSMHEIAQRLSAVYSKVVPSRGGSALPFVITARRAGLINYKNVKKINPDHILAGASLPSIDNPTAEDLFGSIELCDPARQLEMLVWLDVEDFESA